LLHFRVVSLICSHLEKNQGEVRLKTRYPKVVQWAKEQGAVIFFADESRVRADGHRGTTWAPMGVLEKISRSIELVKSFFQMPDTKYACATI
jgi:hypothetical protein